ncbi:MAG TPA: DUF1398 family protein [Cellvibrionaceae bacterium]|nr:DUF1398 family protein [Cellvibrionaceae bacterium]HMW71105.1 DUF1398 family protein [Cellvibrionaceae bacterium]HMY38727.1 DUF1398 family protein [Marinagarivorans sp.]
MTQTPEHIIRATFTASNEGRMHFGEVIGKLMQAGVQSYQVDYRSRQSIYYLHNDDALILQLAPTEQTIAADFSVEKIVAAIRGAQRGTVMYPEFKRLSMEAGCIGYNVWISGRHVTYLGRKGETHVEHFPNS